jgi:hypothetical protein
MSASTSMGTSKPARRRSMKATDRLAEDMSDWMGPLMCVEVVLVIEEKEEEVDSGTPGVRFPFPLPCVLIVVTVVVVVVEMLLVMTVVVAPKGTPPAR